MVNCFNAIYNKIVIYSHQDILFFTDTNQGRRNDNWLFLNICQIEHLRNRSPHGLLINIFAAIGAYHFLPRAFDDAL